MVLGRNVAACALAAVAVAVASTPVQAGKVVDSDLSVSFTPPPYFQATKQPEGSPLRYLLVPPDKSVTIGIGGQFDRKLRNASPFEPAQAKAFCSRASAVVPKGLTLKQANRFVLDNQNSVECQFAGAGGRTFHWVGTPVPAQLMLVVADWPKPPSKEQLTLFRQFLGGVQLF